MRASLRKGRSVRVLVVDDRRTIGRMIEKMLGDLGHAAECADGEFAARELLSDRVDRFDRVILDLNLGGRDASGLFAWIREISPSLAGQVIVCTGHTGAAETVSFVREHELPVLLKPFSLDEFAAALSSRTA